MAPQIRAARRQDGDRYARFPRDSRVAVTASVTRDCRLLLDQFAAAEQPASHAVPLTSQDEEMATDGSEAVTPLIEAEEDSAPAEEETVDREEIQDASVPPRREPTLPARLQY